MGVLTEFMASWPVQWILIITLAALGFLALLGWLVCDVISIGKLLRSLRQARQEIAQLWKKDPAENLKLFRDLVNSGKVGVLLNPVNQAILYDQTGQPSALADPRQSFESRAIIAQAPGRFWSAPIFYLMIVVGICGTFLTTLVQLEADPSAAATTAVLNAMMVTLLITLYKAIDLLVIHHATVEIERFQDVLVRHFPVFGEIQLQYQILQGQRYTMNQLRNMGPELSASLGDSLQKQLVPAIRTMGQNLSQSFDQMTTHLNEQQQQGMGELAGHFARQLDHLLGQNFTNLATSIQTMNSMHEASSKRLQELIALLDQSANLQGQSQEAAKLVLDSLAESRLAITDSSAKLDQIYATSAETLTQTFNGSAENLARTFNTSTEQLSQTFGNGTEKLGLTFSTSGEQILQIFTNGGEILNKSLATGSDQLTQSYGSGAEQLQAALRQGADQIDKALNLNHDKLNDALTASADYFKQALVSNAENLITSLSTSTGMLNVSTDRLNESTGLLNQSLTTITEKLNQVLETSTAEMMQAFATAADELNQKYASGSDTLSLTFTSGTEQLKQALSTGSDQLAQIYSSSKIDLSQAIVSGTEQLSQSLAISSEQLSKSLLTSSEQLSLNLAANSDRYNQSLLSGTEQLGDALIRTSELASNLQELLAASQESSNRFRQDQLQVEEQIGGYFDLMHKQIIQVQDDLQTNLVDIFAKFTDLTTTSLTQSDEQYQAMVTKLSEDSTQLMNMLDDQVRDLSFLVRDIASEISGLNKSMDGSLQLFGEQMQNSTRITFESFDKGLADVVGQLTDTIRLISDAVDDLPAAVVTARELLTKNQLSDHNPVN